MSVRSFVMPLFCLAGCDGLISTPMPSREVVEDFPSAAFLPPKLYAVETPDTTVRRLSIRELTNVVNDLFGVTPSSIARMPVDAHDYLYDRVVETQTVTATIVEGYLALGDELTEILLAGKLADLVSGCDAFPSSFGSTSLATHRPCVENFIDTIAPRAFRRPLTADERARLLALYDQASEPQKDVALGLGQVVLSVVNAPDFAYVIEHGTPLADDPQTLQLDAYSLAARLSFALCERLPDDALRAAAAAGTLTDPAVLATHAVRLLESPCAKATIENFYRQWLSLYKIAGLPRDEGLFPQFTAQVASAMERETLAFLNTLTWDDDGSLRDVFAASFSMLDRDTGTIYGIDGLGTTPQRVLLPATRRGLLTHPSVLTLTSQSNATVPVKRGVFVLRHLMCTEIPPPPASLNITPPPPDPNATTRQRWARHSADPNCSSCHRFLDPAGFAMEDFDAIGQYRTIENDMPVDAGGGAPLVGIEDGEVNGAAELSVAISEREELRRCFARQWTRFVLGRKEAQTDTSAVEAALEVLRTNGPLTDVSARVVTSDAFRHRRIGR